MGKLRIIGKSGHSAFLSSDPDIRQLRQLLSVKKPLQLIHCSHTQVKQLLLSGQLMRILFLLHIQRYDDLLCQTGHRQNHFILDRRKAGKTIKANHRILHKTGLGKQSAQPSKGFLRCDKALIDIIQKMCI